MKTCLNVFCLVVVLLLLMVLGGCNTTRSQSANIFIKHDTGDRIRIAVLPFDNVSRNQEAGTVVTNAVITYLLSTGQFDVLEPGVVNDALNTEGIRMNQGLSSDACKKLSARLNTDAFIIGLVEEYGEIHVNSDSYPSIAFSARLLDAKTADILWAGSISKTGDENVTVFDLGRVSSLTKLTKMAVDQMARSLAKSRKELFTVPQVATAKPPTPATTDTPPVATPPQPAGAAKYLDETPTYGEAELTAMLKSVGTMKAGTVDFTQHYHAQVSTRYSQGADHPYLEVTLIDYRKVETAKRFLALDHPDEKTTTVEGLPAYTGASVDFPIYIQDIAVGRFRLTVKGPTARRADIEALSTGLIQSLQ